MTEKAAVDIRLCRDRDVMPEEESMIKTVIAINSGTGSFSGDTGKPMTDREYRNELEEIIALTNQAKKRLLDLTEETDVDGKRAESLEEALNALYDAVDSMEDALENEEE